MEQCAVVLTGIVPSGLHTHIVNETRNAQRAHTLHPTPIPRTVCWLALAVSG